MNNLYDTLEICLRELEKGTDLDSLLARHPEHAAELLPMLQASIRARSMSAGWPSAEVIRRGRAKLMQRAAELREEKVVVPVRKPSKRVIPMFQRLAITLSLTATLLASGTGLVGASSNALPGENLYPVKRTWEDMRLFFTFDTNQRDVLESEFESERLHEANELIADGRHETIQFAGVFMEVNGKAYVSGIEVLITANTQLPAEVIQTGSAVVITGHTNANGFVELETMTILPAGAVVPIGNPIEVETPESSNDENSTGSAESTSIPGGAAQVNQTAQPASNSSTFKLDGIVDSFSNNAIMVNGQLVYLDANTIIEGQINPGSKVEIEGYYDNTGKFIIKKIKVAESKSGDGSGSSSDSGSGNSNSGSGSDNSGSGSNDSGAGGSGGGGDDHGGGGDG